MFADFSWESFVTEHQNDPPAEDDESLTRLTGYHIEQKARSDHDRYVVPADTVLVTRGADISEGGVYWVSIAWSDQAAGAIVDFDYEKFEGVEGMPMAACERLVLDGLQHWWHAQEESPYEIQDAKDGDGWLPDLTLIDSGWKDPAWGTQPVYLLASQMGFSGVLPCKGIPNWRPKAGVRGKVWPYPEANVCLVNGVYLAELHVDAAKLHVHHGLLQPFGTAGSLGLYSPPRDERGREDIGHTKSYQHHILSEEWQRQSNGVHEWVAAGTRPGGRKRKAKRNHWLDATAYAVAARDLWGVWTVRRNEPDEPDEPPTPSRSASIEQELALSGGGTYRAGRSW